MGLPAQKIAEYIGKEKVFDDKVIKVSKNRFKEIISAFKKIKFTAYQQEIININTDIEIDKIFINSYEIYLANGFVNELTIQALEHGVFKNNNEANLRQNAEKGKKALMLYLIEIGSAYAGVLSDIKIEEESKELITITEFIRTKKESIHNSLIYGDSKKIHTDRFNRIFTYIEKETISKYNAFKKENIERLKNNKFLLSVEQMINIVIEDSNKQTDEYNSTNKLKNFHNNNFEYIKKYLHTLIQQHEYYHLQKK